MKTLKSSFPGSSDNKMNHTATQRHTADFGTGNLGLQIAETSGNITANFNYKSDESEVLQNRECLQALCETNPQRDKDRIERHKGGLLEDAYVWVLENAEFKRWRFEEKDQLLWIKGDPGKGKTMLLCGILNELTKSTIASETTIVYFFCQTTDAKLNNATGVLRGLIYMLVGQHPYLMSYVRCEYDKDKRIFEDRRNSWDTLSQILVKILEDPMLQNVYVLIDALDECTTDLSLLLEFIVQVQVSNMYGKWLVTSRNETSIEEILEDHEIESKKENLSLELNEDSVSKAVESFINFRLEILSRRKKYSPGTRDAVTKHLLSNAHGTFLWVALVCEELLSPRLSNFQVPKKLKQFPAGLDKLYQRMLDQIDGDPDAEICKYILGVTTTVYRPLTLEELSSYIDFSEDDDISYLSQLIGLCGSFLTLRGSTVSLVHQSANDFIHQSAVDQIFPHGPEKVHHAIFSKSLNAINKTLRRDIYDLVHPGYEIGKVEQPDPDPLAAVRYPCIYWVDHLNAYSGQARAKSPDDFAEGGAIEAFFREDYLNWLEAISLMKGVSKGMASISKLEDIIESETQNPGLIDRAKDGYRFFLYHQTAIRSCPLQVYTSALIFSPVNSITRIQYEEQQPLWVAQKPDMEYQWSTCLQTLHLKGFSDQARWISFSYDFKLFASIFSVFPVQIFDTRSGECLTTLILEHSNQIDYMTFSRDSRLLLCLSRSDFLKTKCLIELWDTDKGHCIMRVEEKAALTVALYEPNCIVCGMASGNISIWNIESRSCFKVLEGHTEDVTAVTISQNLGLLASASDDCTIRIWDLCSGKCVQILEGHELQLDSVAFSSDSHILASGSRDGSVKLWNTKNWDCIHTLFRDGFRNGRLAEPLVFSHDSTVLAVGSKTNDIYLWDTRDGLLFQTLKGHKRGIISIAFSHDSKLLASGSRDDSIRIWDVTSKEPRAPRDLDGHNSGARLYFSQDSTLLATEGVDKPYDIKIWDAHNGKCLRTINKSNAYLISLLRFSHDLKYLAGLSLGEGVIVWDLRSGERLPFSDHRPLK